MSFLKKITNNEQINDNICLVVQGGGIRGVYSMAALSAFEELKLTNKFNYIVGSSAGAINGAYFIDKKAKEGTEAYINELSVQDFINPFRFKKKVNIDFLVDLVVKNTVKLSTSNVFKSSTELEIVLTDSKTLKTKYLSNKKHTFDMYEALRATMAMPLFYDKKIKVLDDLYIDGGISDYIPLLRAVNKGYKKIVVILTSCLEPKHDKFKFIKNLLLVVFNKKLKLRKAILSEDIRFNKIVNFIKSEPNDLDIICIYPTDINRLVGTIEISKEKIIDCALMAREDIYSKLGLSITKTDFFDIWQSKAQMLNQK